LFLSRGIGVKADPAAAVGWWRKGGAQGHADSLNALAAAFENGEGVAADKPEAVRLYRQAAERGSKEAQQRLAALGPAKASAAGQAEFDEGTRLYKAGQHAAAAKQFLRAAELGHARAQLQIGYQYNYGEGVPVNAGEAVKWYTRAAGQGDATARSNLGSMYEHGQGVREDWVEAARWYARSAAQDHAAGQFSLGRAYQFGIGVPQNRKLAIEWFQKASFRGHAQARFFAQHLLSRGNFVGFRDEREEAYVIAGKLRTGLLWEEPVGVLFHHSGERLAYIKNLRHRVDRYEAYTAWVIRRNDYDDCQRSNRSGCSDPGPAPQ
jgi:TPR repeat protein